MKRRAKAEKIKFQINFEEPGGGAKLVIELLFDPPLSTEATQEVNSQVQVSFGRGTLERLSFDGVTTRYRVESAFYRTPGGKSNAYRRLLELLRGRGYEELNADRTRGRR